MPPDQDTTPQPQPLHVEPAQEPWRPRQGLLTRIAVWAILLVMAVTLILMGIMAIMG